MVAAGTHGDPHTRSRVGCGALERIASGGSCLGAAIMILAVFAVSILFQSQPRNPREKAAREVLADSCGGLGLVSGFEVTSERDAPQGRLTMFKATCLHPLNGRDLIYGYLRSNEGGRPSGWWAKADGPPFRESVEFV